MKNGCILVNYSLNDKTACTLFDTYVNNILSYSSEVWGIHRGADIEEVPADLCKQLLCAERTTLDASVYCELGRYPLKYQILYTIFK